MRRLTALLLIPALALAGCREQQHGAMKVVVIGSDPKLRDPALGPLPTPASLLLQNVAQGLVRFDASGNIVPGLAERWNVTDDGLSYIFKLTAAHWPDGTKVTADQVARLLKRQLAARSRNTIKDTFGAVEDVVAMTDRVVEIRLVAPRPTLLALLAQPEMGILRGGQGSGPFRVQGARATTDGLTLTRDLAAAEDEAGQREELLLTAQPPPEAITAFAAGRTDLVLGGSFVDLPLARQVKLPRNALRFDPASGLFGLVPVHSGGKFDTPAVRQLLSEALDRTNYVNATGVPGLGARATLIEPALEGVAAPTPPAWASVPFRDRLAGLRAQAQALFGQVLPKVSVAVPEGPGGDLLIREFQRDWGAIGITVSKATSARGADFLLIDEVAPSASAAWFVRRFRCGVVPVCSPAADQLMDAARQSPIAAQRYALLAQAAATIDEAQLFIPITAPVRWSLVSPRVQNFAGNRYARHTLTDLGQRSGGE